MTLAKVSPGQPLRIPAETFNAFVDAAVAYQADRLGQCSGDPAIREQTGIVLLRNDSGAARQRFDVLTLGNPLVLPGADIQRFPSRISFRGLAPDTSKPGRFAVLQEPIAAGAIGRACIDGITPVAVDIVAVGDPYAEVVTGQPDALRSGASGSVLILWAGSGTGRQQAVVRLLGPTGAASASGERIEMTVSYVVSHW
ncbi:MAG: hypothetical protein J0M02_00530 [Planctomycetes bacterium]|nr:hypothetical protein [Planctomycetota bacterium]